MQISLSSESQIPDNSICFAMLIEFNQNYLLGYLGHGFQNRIQASLREFLCFFIKLCS